MSGCGTIPRVNAYIHTNPVNVVFPEFVAPGGPLTARQAKRVLAHLQAGQDVPTDILRRHLVIEQAISDTPLVLGNKVTLLENGAKTYDAMLEAIRQAKDSINLEMYIFSDGAVGRRFADALIDRQRHGVQVNIIYDAFGCLDTADNFFERMRQNGIAILEYRPLDPFETRLRWAPTHRDHRKLLIVDGRVAFTGGVNISEHYGTGASGTGRHRLALKYWRDTDVRIEGPAVAEFQRFFVQEWQYQRGPALNQRNYFPHLSLRGDDVVRAIASVPERFSRIYVTLVSAVMSSETNVYITDAYFAPDGQMLHALENAARRGVDVRLLLPGTSDEPLTVAAQRSHYAELLASGVKIYEWQGAMLHAKTATIDGVWSTVGTSNLDWWSIARDNEINAIIISQPFAGDMSLTFRNDLESSAQVRIEQWQHREWWERLDEALARMIQPLL